MDQAAYSLDEKRGDVVLEAIQEVCQHRGWRLLAAQVRTSHVHSLIEAEAAPELVMAGFKACASPRLNKTGLDKPGRKRWPRHGSTRWLLKPQHVSAAIQYCC
jgi:REP element-mobilizing transposase RayT